METTVMGYILAKGVKPMPNLLGPSREQGGLYRGHKPFLPTSLLATSMPQTLNPNRLNRNQNLCPETLSNAHLEAGFAG